MIGFNEKQDLSIALPSGIGARGTGANNQWTWTNFINGVNQQDSNGNPIPVVPPGICGATPQNVQDLIWTKSNGMELADPACVDSTIVGASGTWFMNKSVAGPCLFGAGPVGLSATLCNPGAAYMLTVTIPWASSGNILDIPPGGPYPVSFSLLFNGVSVSNVVGDVATDTPNPVVLSAMLPALGSTLVTLYFAAGAILPGPPADFVLVQSVGNLVITPPTHP